MMAKTCDARPEGLREGTFCLLLWHGARFQITATISTTPKHSFLPSPYSLTHSRDVLRAQPARTCAYRFSALQWAALIGGWALGQLAHPTGC